MLLRKFIDQIGPGSDRVQALLEAEAVEATGVEAEAVDEIAASTSLVTC